LQSTTTLQPIELIAHVFSGRIFADCPVTTTKSGGLVKGLHAINAVLFVLNALLWALVAKQPAFASLWLAVGLGELYVVRKTDLLST
jgi:hypothetical protein